MSAKNLDKHNRWRNKTVAFRVSPEEDAQIETAVKLTGLTKQDYIIRRLLCRDVVVQGNPRVYKALRDQLAAVLDELRRIAADRNCKKEFVQKARHTLGYLQLCMDIARGRHADVGALQKDFESSRAPLHRLDVQYRIALALRHRGDRTGMEKSREYLLENSGGTCYGELARAL